MSLVCSFECIPTEITELLYPANHSEPVEPTGENELDIPDFGDVESDIEEDEVFDSDSDDSL